MKRGKPLERRSRLRRAPERTLVDDGGVYRVASTRRTGEQRTCAECGESFYVKASRLGERKFCSRKCFHARSRKSPEALARESARQSEARRGSGNPAWRGRDTEGSIYRVFNVRLKGEVCCRNCGSTAQPLHLHHIVPRSVCRAGRRDLRNGVTLCASCHARWHDKTLTIYRDIFTADEWEFVSSLELLGQSIAAWLDNHYPPTRLGPEVRY